MSLGFAHNLSLAISAATQLTFARVVPLADLGLYAFISASVDLAIIPLDWSINRSIINRQAVSDRPAVTWTTGWYLTLVQVLLHCVLAAVSVAVAVRTGNTSWFVAGAVIVARAVVRVGYYCVAGAESELRYGSISHAVVFGAVLGSVSGIWLALHGWNIWALAVEEIVQVGATAAFQFAAERPTLRPRLDRAEAKILGTFAAKMAGLDGIDRLGNQADVVILGAFASMPIVASYTYAKKIILLFVNGAMPLIQKVLFAAYSSERSQLSQSPMQLGVRRAIVAGGLLVAVFLTVWPELIVRVVLGPTFQSAVAPLRILSWAPLFMLLIENERTRLIASGMFLRAFTIRAMQVIGTLVVLVGCLTMVGVDAKSAALASVAGVAGSWTAYWLFQQSSLSGAAVSSTA
jgi:O-antigen/teichoic acid export membrane protein